MCVCNFLFFFKQKTAYEMRISDWSSDVCSSDLPTTCTLYAEKLISDGVLSEAEAVQMVEDYRQLLDEGKHVVKSLVTQSNEALFVDWKPYQIGRASCRERVCQYV